MAVSINRKELLEGPIISSLLKLAIPIVLANVLQSTYQLIDAFWVGRLGGDAVAAVSVTTPVVFLSIALGFGLAVAGSTLIAQYVGAGNFSMVNHVAAQTMLMVILVSVLLGVVGYVFTPGLLKLIGVAPEVYPGARGFMRVTFSSLVFNFLFLVFQSFMRSTGHPKVPVYIVLGTVVLNFILDPLLIFGWGPIPAKGVTGAALATLITQAIAALIGMVMLFRGRYGIRVRRKDFMPDWAYIKRAFLLGVPASIEQSMRGLGLIVMTFLITSFGTLTLAAYGVGSNVLQVIMIPAMGLSVAVSTLVGQNIGAGNVERAAQIGRLGTTLGFWILTGFGILAYVLAPYLIAFFVPDDPLVIGAGSRFLRTMSLAWGFIAIQLSLTGVFRASGNMVIAMIIALISQWVLQFPLAYVLSRHTSLGAAGLWWAFPVTNVITALIAWAIFRKGDWKKKRLTDEDAELTRRVADDILTEEGVRQ